MEAEVPTEMEVEQEVELDEAALEEKELEEEMQRRIDEINQGIQKKAEDAEKLLEYLQKQKEVAALAEEAEEEELKKRGIIIGQHIPSLKSKLEVQPEIVANYGDFSSTLLIARELVDQNKDNFLRRTGNLPITELAELRQQQQKKKLADMPEDVPHYVYKTKTTTVREQKVAVRFEDTLKTRELERTKTIEQTAANPRKKFPQKKVLSAEQRIENENILKSINHKLNYLRNPRNDPSAVTKMLVKPKSYFTNGPASVAGMPANSSVVAAESMAEFNQSSVTNGRSIASKHANANAHASVSHEHQKPSIRAKSTMVKDNPLFTCSPSVATFSGYDVGKKYTVSLVFRNISAVSRSIRVLQPKQSYFRISPLKYPANCSDGMVAPGISLSTTLIFIPVSLGDFSDYIQVDTESGSFHVPIIAQRESPKLSLSSVLDIGACLVGDAVRIQLECINHGGPGKFMLFLPGEDMDNASNADAASVELWDAVVERGCVRTPPFTIYPTAFSLSRNESVPLTIEFVPLQLGLCEKDFSILYDNGEVHHHKIQGHSKEVSISIDSINSVTFDSVDVSIYKNMIFSPSILGSEQTQQFSVINNTGLPVEYEWIWLSSNVTDLTTAGQETIRKRELEDQRKLADTGSDILDVGVDTSYVGKTLPEETKNLDITAISDLPAAARANLLKSIRMDDTKTFANRASQDGFDLYPARGVLTDSRAEQFTISFTPSGLERISMRPVFMVKSIPRAAYPNKSQSKYLDRLSEEGHGKYTRLKSWLAEIGTPSSVRKYVAPNGEPANTKVLVNFQMLLHIVHTQAFEIGLYGEIDRIHFWANKILRHMFLIRRNEVIDQDDDSSEGELSDDDISLKTSNSTTVALYDWNVDTSAALEVFPIRLLNYIPSKEIGNNGEVLSPDGRVDSLNSPGQGLASPESVADSIRSIYTVEGVTLTEVWVDLTNAILILGPSISQHLDDKVKHDAVEYLKDCALTSVAGVNFLVYGEGKRQDIIAHPPEILIGGHLSIGKEWVGCFKLINSSLSLAEIDIHLNKVQVVKLFGSQCNEFVDEGREVLIPHHETKDYLTISLDHERIILMPSDEIVVTVKMSILMLGKYEVLIPFTPANAATHIDTMKIIADVYGPRIRFDMAEVDLGLIGVGYDTNKLLQFTNESDVPAMFMFKPALQVDNTATLEINKTLGVGSFAPGGSALVSGDGSKAGGTDSRQSTFRSEDGFSIMDGSRASSTDFKIELKNAAVTVEPATGIVSPQQSFTVNVCCKAGKTPQRLRGMLESRIFDVSGKIEVLSQYINLRGEVQAPKTAMYPMNNSLGQVFVGMPVKFTVTVENMCNLPTKYKLLRPGGESSLFRITFDKYKGDLLAKTKVHVECTFTALMPGMIDDVISNKIFGAKYPLGFAVKAIAKGISLEFVNLKDGEEPPLPLAEPTATQLKGGQKPPKASETVPIEIGSVPLYERRVARFAIRNLSAIPAPYTVNPRKFKVMDKVIRFAPTNSASTLQSIVKSQERSDLLLAPHEGGTNKFKSEAGKKYIGVTVERQENQHFLHSGLGASYHIENNSGTVAPWGVEIITVRSYNDIPGGYNDDLEVCVKEGEIEHKMVVPIKMQVDGCPIVIVKDSIGMSTVTKGASEEIGKQLLLMGTAPLNCDPLVKEFFVKNDGSKSGKISWKLRGVARKKHGPVRLKLEVDDSGRTSPRIKYWSDIQKNPPYKIEPKISSVKPYGRQKFVVTFFKTDDIGLEEVQLIADIVFSDGNPTDDDFEEVDESKLPDNDNTSVESSAVELSHLSIPSRASMDRFKLELLARAQIVYPQLLMDKHQLVAEHTSTILPETNSIIMKAHATTLFSSGSKVADICLKNITLLNPLEMLLVFSASTEGPFVIKQNQDDTVTTAAKLFTANNINKKSLMSLSVSNVGATGKIRNANTSSLGRTFSLLPQESATFVVAFNPKKSVREELLESLGKDAGKPKEQDGKLIVSFSTGQSLHIPINAKISTPFLTASTPRMYFGVCHVVQSCQGILLLSNPSDVPARWSFEHVVGGGAWKKSTAIRVRGFEESPAEIDDPDVFVITPNAGMVEGPTVSVPSAMAAPPKDYNRLSDSIVPQRLVESSWAKNTISMQDTLTIRHNASNANAADSCYPMPLTVMFKPKKNVHYSSRYRFTCEFGNSFDLVLQGEGTYEEHMHRPLNPLPK